MVSGSLLAMPMIVINMGAEMVYILDQRLRAQSITDEKSRKVLTDVIRTMYNTKFIDELFKPQEAYSNKSTRQVFDKLAHSSIMRLNTSSMDKLYDLMTMGFKHQLISCSCPEQLVQVTMSHLEALQRIVDNSAVNILLTDVINNVVQTYATMPSAEFWHLKRVLCRFFQDRRVKVSLFLQDSMQNLDGTMVLHRSGPVPVGAEPPGPVRYFEASGTRAGEVQVEPLRVAGCVPASAPDDRMVEAGVRECTLGSNLYSKERRKDGPKPAPGPNAQVNAGIAGAAAPTAAAAEAKNKPAAATTLSRAAGAGAHELTLLSSLLGAADTSADNFKLNLFPDAATGPATSTGGGETSVILIDASERASMQDLIAQMQDLDVGEGGGAADPDDLLSLMDSTA